MNLKSIFIRYIDIFAAFQGNLVVVQLITRKYAIDVDGDEVKVTTDPDGSKLTISDDGEGMGVKI
ncbi:hypothetical protein E0485_18915 [Paenibacillus albiflavus]|uniref:Histidine kinase/HSP90-like ATPase domain-containing protein n=1 Tax=Paenibacillus albiflavus TaxID=2545760 RepID=A0A4V2WNE0_9BACL|nr:hypothetical protein [Paenibacillus albiflavus]TCZ75062.1 hypothetical protein E0485_18915 [Paenibacillus albiflavus]